MTEREIFLEALEMPTPEARAAYLQGACGGEATLRRKVEELLNEHYSNDSLLAGPALEGERTSEPRPPASEVPAQMIGRYKLLERIGEGGFGEVWMAQQREPIHRRVALKIIKPGMDSRQVVARFEAERQALAMMDHANIAKIFDAGVTDNGRPYFVMELVKGIRITDYCDQNNLSTEERLKVFSLVCQAIQHAHQKGIIHRDIKPSNILVTLHDGVPVPKVIDFGIAKATQGELTDKTVFTHFQQFIGTPAYISPEQAEMSGLDIDTRADIYSLGVLLYELLTGCTPFEQKELLAAGLDGMRRIIREQEPPSPSNRLSTMAAEVLTATAHHRHTEPPRLVHGVRGDLDWIVMKCLEKDRARRYETANALAADLRRHLENQPVVARPPSRWYEFQKSVKRHKIGFAAVAAVVLALAIGLGTSCWRLIKERQALARAVAAEREQARLRKQAETNEQKAESAAASSAQVAQFMKDMLKGVGPGVAMGRDTALLKEILDKTAERIGADLKHQPQVEAELRSTLSATYIELGEFIPAEAMAREALRIRRNTLEKNDPLVAGAMVQLASALSKRNQANDLVEAEALVREALATRAMRSDAQADTVGWVALHAGVLNRLRKFPEAETASRKALAMRREIHGPEHKDVASSLDNLALVLRDSGKLAEADQVVREALAMQRKLLGNVSLDTATSLQYLGGILERQKKRPEAEAAYREALDVHRKIFSANNPYTATLISDLANNLQTQGKHAEATSLYRENVAIRKKIHGETDLNAAKALRSLARSLEAEKKLAEAESVYREALEVSRKINSAEYTSTLLTDLTKNLKTQGKPAATASLFRDEVALQKKIHGETHLNVAHALGNLARSLEAEGNLPGAEQTARDALAIQRKLSGNVSSNTAASLQYLGSILERQKKVPEAESVYRDALEVRRKASNPDSPYTAALLADLAKTLLTQGKPAEATSLYREEVAIRKKIHGETNRAVVVALGHLASSLEAEGKLVEAEVTWREELAVERKLSGDEHPWVANSLISLANVVFNAGRPGEAEPLCREALAIRRKSLGNKDHATRNSLGWLRAALLYQGKHAEAIALFREELDLVRTADGKGWASTNSELGTILHHFADALWQQKQFKEARPPAEEAWALYQQHPDWPENERTHAWQVLHKVLTSLNDQPALELLYRKELESLRRKLPPEDPAIADNLFQLAAHLLAQQKFTEADATHHQALTMRHSLALKAAESSDVNALQKGALFLATCEAATFRNGPRAVELAEKAARATGRTNSSILATLAAAYAETGEFAKAVSVQKEAMGRLTDTNEMATLSYCLDLYLTKQPYRQSSFKVRTADWLATGVMNLLAQGMAAEVELSARACLAIREQMLPDDWRTFNSRSQLGGSLLGQKKYTEAEPLLLAGYAGMKQREAKIPPAGRGRLRETLQRLVQLHEATNRPEKAAEWNKKLAEFNQTEAKK